MVEFKLTDNQLKKILDASKPTLCIMVGGIVPPTPQDNANAAWRSLGDELGFDYLTVRPVPGKDEHYFTATPTVKKE
jgi:hypothetical protein